ncbi:uncharacterized protein [Lepeophtheirus salmonis]|uniref:uncharacterized protein isoform X1 n=1 Tax=Lepeophtheirus salmonis TaxID=72036 RepID=UPI001AE39981|nr:uncharacterized protein LOC121121220 [Lepeophtheirus salmonis]
MELLSQRENDLFVIEPSDISNYKNHHFFFKMSEKLLSTGCQLNCSGRGECLNGTCYCQIRFEGSECKTINFYYHVVFASIFFLLALTSVIQLVMCIHAEFLRMKKNPSILRACRITTQKCIYFLVFLASILRGAYFAAPTIGSEWSTSLMSAYYPVVLTGSSLIVCFWAEVFHLPEIRWERPRFLSKSYLGFITFNIINYTLLLAELILIQVQEEKEFYTHVFNGCFAVLMFICVVFFLVYGVEVFVKVRGGFTVSQVPSVINNSSRIVSPATDEMILGESVCLKNMDRSELETSETLLTEANLNYSSFNNTSTSNNNNNNKNTKEIKNTHDLHYGQLVNTSQLHQSRLGLLSQAVMMMVTVGFLFAETMGEFWKSKVDLSRLNTHDVIFRIFEVGVAVWFPCVLWNCIRPEQLWCLNPKKILERLPPSIRDVRGAGNLKEQQSHADNSDDDDDKGPECWICYDDDRTDAGPFINPCNCRGDVGAVHHDCLRRWLVESADNPDALKCKVCSAEYMVEKGSTFSLKQGFTPLQWVQTVSLVSAMCIASGGGWAICYFYPQSTVKLLIVGANLVLQCVFLRFLGLNTVSAYQRAKVSAMKIVNARIRGGRESSSIPSPRT